MFPSRAVSLLLLFEQQPAYSLEEHLQAAEQLGLQLVSENFRSAENGLSVCQLKNQLVNKISIETYFFSYQANTLFRVGC